MACFRSPRNPNEDPYANALLMLGEATSPRGIGGAIEEQVTNGQREIVNSDVIPTRLIYCTEQDLTDLGFTLGETVEGDPLFRRATLPDGWSREGSEHAMWSYLIDEQGRRRCPIFYKAALGGRDSFISITPLAATDGRPPMSETQPSLETSEVLGYVVLINWDQHTRPQFGAVPQLHELQGDAEDEAEYLRAQAAAAGRDVRYAVAQLVPVDANDRREDVTLQVNEKVGLLRPAQIQRAIDGEASNA